MDVSVKIQSHAAIAGSNANVRSLEMKEVIIVEGIVAKWKKMIEKEGYIWNWPHQKKNSKTFGREQ